MLITISYVMHSARLLLGKADRHTVKFIRVLRTAHALTGYSTISTHMFAQFYSVNVRVGRPTYRLGEWVACIQGEASFT